MGLVWPVLYGLSSAGFVALNKTLLTRLPPHSELLVLGIQQTIVLLVYALLKRRRLFAAAGLKASLPVAGAFLTMIVANLWCLKLSSVGIYTVTRSSSLLFSLALSRWLLGRVVKLTFLNAVGCGLVSLSIAIAGKWEECSVIGLAAGLTASVAQASFSILILKTMRRTAVTTVVAGSPNVYGTTADGDSSIFDTPLSLLGHYTLISAILIWAWVLFSRQSLPPLLPHMPLVGLTGAANALTAISGVCMLKTRSPVFVSLIGHLKTSLQLMLARLWLREVLQRTELITVVGTIAGSLIYSLGSHGQQFFGTRKIKL